MKDRRPIIVLDAGGLVNFNPHVVIEDLAKRFDVKMPSLSPTF